MNRKQRRMMERQNRQDEVRVSRADLIDLKQTVTDRAITAASEDLTVCFMLALRHKFGFGAVRIFRALEEIDRLMGLLNEDPDNIYKLQAELKDETGVVIDYSDAKR